MRRSAPSFTISVLLTLALAAAACGGSASSSPEPGVTIEALASATAEIPRGGKPAAPPTATTEPPQNEPTPPPAQTPAIEPTAVAVEPTATPQALGPPTTGRWIDVDVSNFVVRLMDGAAIVEEIAPVGVGVQIDTGAYLSTQTGLFQVHTKDERLVYDAPYDTYISHWVGFDAQKDNGFHSFLKDASGAVVDASTGRVSNGCIRTGAPERIFAFAEIGMPVWVHW